MNDFLRIMKLQIIIIIFQTLPDNFEAMMKQQELFIEWRTRPEGNDHGPQVMMTWLEFIMAAWKFRILTLKYVVFFLKIYHM